MTIKNIFISLIMVAITGIATWMTILSSHPSSSTNSPPQALPDAFMEDVTAIIINKFGKPTMKIVTPKLVHYAENDRTHLTSPQLTLYRKSPIPWYVTANFAESTQGIEDVNFWDDVVIHHAADQTNPATIIKTNTLIVHPNKQTAETTDLITLTQPSIIVKAVGMHADMNSGDIKLLSQTRGEYVPTS